MIKLGLTGSIGMGKSTTAAMFKNHGCAVWDADAAVHRLYAKGGLAVDQLKTDFPTAVSPDGVNRTVLRRLLRDTPALIETLNKIVHPLVAEDRQNFIAGATASILVFDIPLLFENHMEREFDATACVLTSADLQERRVLARKTMTKADLDLILSRQLPAAEKAEKADYIICTDTLGSAQRDVLIVMKELEAMVRHA